MNAAKSTEEDYINFLLGSPRQATATEASRCDPRIGEVAHDAYTRLLYRLEPQASVLWEEVRPDVQRQTGYLVLDDTVLDKPYAKKMDLVHVQYSGKHKTTVKGIGLVTLLWTNGDRCCPCDYRIYDKQEGKTKNDYFQELIETAKERGFSPNCVLFDSWYSSLKNLKLVRSVGWNWLTQLKPNRLVNPENRGLI